MAADLLPLMAGQGFSTALAGNTLLLSYFLGKGERAAALVQTIGAASNFVMLGQVSLCGGGYHEQQNIRGAPQNNADLIDSLLCAVCGRVIGSVVC